MALIEKLRIGAGTVETDAVGGDFSSPSDLGNTSKEKGIVFNYSVDTKEIGCAQDITIEEILLIAENLELEFDLKEHKLEHIALSFGHPTTDVVDDTVASPNFEEIEFGGARALPELAIRLRTLQPGSTTLYDIVTIYKGVIIPMYSQAYKADNERYIPVKVKALGDPANSGKLGKFRSEKA